MTVPIKHQNVVNYIDNNPTAMWTKYLMGTYIV